MKTFIPDSYSSELNLYETQAAIDLIKKTFQDTLTSILRLKRVSAPLFVDPETGMNDNLSGSERAVRFDIPYTKKGCRSSAVVGKMEKICTLSLRLLRRTRTFYRHERNQKR